jgi:type III restriction enzyme
VSIGFVRKGEFSKLPSPDEGNDASLGYRKSDAIWNHIKQSGFIDKDGRVLGTFAPNQLGFTLNLPDEFKLIESDIIETIARCKIEHFVKQKRDRKSRALNKEMVASPEFEEFWHNISRRTTYRVSVDRQSVIDKSVAAIQQEEQIRPLRIQVTRAGVRILRGGAKGEELGTRSASLAGNYELPDIIAELQEATSLTRKTIVDILIQSERLGEFIHNPNDFIQMVKRCLTSVLSDLVVEGIQYEKISGSVYELRELQRDGIKERDRFVDQMYEVRNKQKTDFDWIVYDSEVERQFAEILDSREDIKLFVKLPAKFKVPTPVGEYNPDWAIVKHEDGADRIYMIRETKSTSQDRLLRPIEVAKIKCGRKHFAAIGIEDYAKSSPENWNLDTPHF